MWSSAVVVLNILGEHEIQVSLIDDQHAVGEFGSEVADEELEMGEAIPAKSIVWFEGA